MLKHLFQAAILLSLVAEAWADPIKIPAQPLDPTPQLTCKLPGPRKLRARLQLRIHEDGKVTVTLLDSTGDTELDESILNSLSKWRWQPASVDGHPVETLERIRLELDIE